MTQEVTVSRTKLHVPSIDDPEREVYQIEYRRGMLPPRFVYCPVKEWTKEKEAELIKADIAKTLKPPSETISI